jgi:hypothetical protein
MGPTGLTMEKRFWKRVNKTNNCWYWDHENSFGYGKFGIKTKKGWTMRWAHRVAYELVKGPIPKNLEIDHLCRNRLCVNPKHLEAVSKKENLLRGIGNPANNARKTHCSRGHEFTFENTRHPKNDIRKRDCRKCNTIRTQNHRNKLK